jgi:hypothetical protein
MPQSPIKKGIATIFWGTDNIMNAPAGAIIESGKVTPKNGAPIEIEGNNGFAASLVFLKDGFDADVKVLYDTAKTWPGNAAALAMSLPNFANNGNIETFSPCWAASDPEIDDARKKERMLGYKLVFRPDVTS